MKKEVFTCPKCKKKISEIDEFCPHCGFKITSHLLIDKVTDEYYLDRKSKEILDKDSKKEKWSINNKSIIFIFLLVMFILGLLWFIGQIPICGDKYCVAKECSKGCRDCNPNKCQDDICQPQISENCKNSQDCSCDINKECDPSNANSDKIGCYEIKCGDSKCDSKKENQENCCLDCGCVSGYTCNREKNECQFLLPEISIDYYNIISGVSASTIYSNRKLKDDSGVEHPFATFRIKNSGGNIAKNVILTIGMGTYSEKESSNLGDIDPSKDKTFNWYPTATEEILNIKDDQNLLITLNIVYEDEHSKDYTFSKSYPIEVVGRSTWGTYSSHSQFVTPLESVVRQAVSAAGSFSTQNAEGINQAAEDIWNLLGGLDIDYISDPSREYRQYPAEVLKTKRGDCDDLATLYVSLLESVGVPSALIYIPGHLFAGYYAGENIYPIETTLIGSSFNSAFEKGKEEYNGHSDKKVIKIEDEWSKKDIKTPAYVGVDSVDMKFPNINTQINQNANWECIQQGFLGFGCVQYRLSITCDLDFINSGSSSGQKCVNVVAYKDESIVKTETVCENVSAGDNVQTSVVYTEDTSSSYAFKYRCEIK
jgi:hypothetical protein